MTSGINRGIAEAHQCGIVTSATLMAKSGAFDEAAALARSLTGNNAHFSVGCHVVLLDGEPVLPAGRVRSLLQPSATQNGSRFRINLSDFVVASFRGKLQPDELEAEAAAQIQRLQAAGVQLSHFDTHKHAHMFPVVLRPLLRAARACKVPAVRNPFGQMWPLPLTDALRQLKLWKRLAQLSVLRNFAATFRKEVEAHGLRTTDGSVAVLVTGVLNPDLFGKIVDHRQYAPARG